MKKILLGLGLFFGLTLSVKAQVEPHAIGLRFGGGNYGSGAEISYQHGIGSTNRLEADLGWSSYNAGFGYKASFTVISASYHWVFNIKDGLNWYVGPGGQLLLLSSYWGGGIAAGFGGQIGMEYNFNTMGLPLQVGLDVRPMYYLISGYGGSGWTGGLSARYTF